MSQIFSGSRRHFWYWAFVQFGYPGSQRHGDFRAEVVVFAGSGGRTVTVTGGGAEALVSTKNPETARVLP